MSVTKVKNVNVLCLDGGGVRGLSTLIILGKLMSLINETVDPICGSGEQLFPGDIFDLVVGTSTGGLIALMIVKLGFGPDRCIELYKELSREIFSHSHWVGKLTGGFGRVKKFSGKHLREVLVKKVINPGLQHPETAEGYHVEEIQRHQALSCAVVCHELDRETMNRLDDPELLLCSHRDQIGEASLCHHPCRHQYGGNEAHVLVADAARATSAAPTYFSHVDILGKFLVDGGYGQTNNPSYATWQHYFEWSPRANYGRVNLVNLGTGSKPKGHKGNKGWFDYFPNTLLPGFVKTMKTLAALATDSEQAARHMRSIEKAGDKLKFSRFSANTGGIHAIALHEYERMDEIVASTNEYLQDEVVLADLTRVANELVEAWRVRQPLKTTPTTRIATAHLQAATEPILRPSHEIAAPNQPHSAAGSMPGLAQSYVASDDTAYAIQPLHMNDTNIFSESANFKTPYHDPMRMLSPDWQVLSGQENSPELSQQPLCTTWRDGGHLEPPENTPDVTPEPSRSSSRSRYEFGTAYKEIMPGRHVEENPQPEADA